MWSLHIVDNVHKDGLRTGQVISLKPNLYSNINKRHVKVEGKKRFKEVPQIKDK